MLCLNSCSDDFSTYIRYWQKALLCSSSTCRKRFYSSYSWLCSNFSTRSQTSTSRITMLTISALSLAGQSQYSVRKVQRRSSQESLMALEVVPSNSLPFLVTLTLSLLLRLFSGELMIFSSSSSMMSRSFSKIFSKLMISSLLKASHSPEIFLSEFTMQRLNSRPCSTSLLKVLAMCLWIASVDFRQLLTLPLTYSMSVYISLQRQSLRSKELLPVLLKAYSRMRQFSSFCSFSLTFASNSSILVTDLFTKIRLRLNSSIVVISFLRYVRTAFTILGCSNISFQPMRSSGSLQSIRFTRSTRSAERVFSGMSSFRTLSYLKYSLVLRYFRPWSKKGNSPLKAMRQSTTPREKMSILELPSFCCGISGAMQMGVPFTERVCISYGSFTNLESPKSAILKSPLCRSMFSGLMSR